MTESLSLNNKKKEIAILETEQAGNMKFSVLWTENKYVTQFHYHYHSPTLNQTPPPHSPQTTSSCWLLQAFIGLCFLFQSRQRQQAFSLITPQTCLFRYPNRRIFNIRSRGRTWACDNHHLHGFSLVQCHIISSSLQNVHTSYNNYKC